MSENTINYQQNVILGPTTEPMLNITPPHNTQRIYQAPSWASNPRYEVYISLARNTPISALCGPVMIITRPYERRGRKGVVDIQHTRTVPFIFYVWKYFVAKFGDSMVC